MKIRYFRKPENFFLEDLAQVIRRFSANGYHTHYFNQNKEAVFEDIATMQAAVQKRGINLLVLILPVFKVESFDDYYLEPVHEEIIREMRARRIDVIDTLPRFRDSGLSPQIFAHDVWHMKAKGHDLVGQTVAELLMQSLPISP